MLQHICVAVKPLSKAKMWRSELQGDEEENVWQIWNLKSAKLPEVNSFWPLWDEKKPSLVLSAVGTQAARANLVPSLQAQESRCSMRMFAKDIMGRIFFHHWTDSRGILWILLCEYMAWESSWLPPPLWDSDSRIPGEQEALLSLFSKSSTFFS